MSQMDSRSRLMRQRVRTVLLLGTQYDAYVVGLAGLGVSGHPSSDLLGVKARCILAEHGPQALDVVERGEADLVLSSLSLAGEDPFELIGKIKEMSPYLPAVLLTSNPSYHGPLCQGPPIAPFDSVYAWRGEEELLQSLINMVEDRLNADHDVLVGGVQVILLIEDEPGLYSKYLPMLYREIWNRVRELTPMGAPTEEVKRRGQARTKILLAHTFEDALLLLSRYGDSLCGVLTDLQFCREGALDAEAGLVLARHVKSEVRESIPVIVQSRDRDVEGPARDAGAFFIWKNSDHLLRRLRRIMLDYFGFGDFIFRLPDGDEVARARDLEQLVGRLREVPPEVFELHGSRDHFSTWLFIHGEHELALRLRAIRETSEVTRAQAIKLISETLGVS